MDAQSVQRTGEKNTPTPSSGRADNGAAVVRSVPGRTIAQFTVIVLASACGNLAQTALNSMLGFIASDMSVGVETAQWLTTGYMLALGVTVPACTFLMRRLSRRVLVAGAIILFAAGSVVCMLAGCFGILLLGRIMEAISAGITLPLMQTTAMTSFPPGRQATAMGVAGIAMGFAPNIGPHNRRRARGYGRMAQFLRAAFGLEHASAGGCVRGPFRVVAQKTQGRALTYPRSFFRASASACCCSAFRTFRTKDWPRRPCGRRSWWAPSCSCCSCAGKGVFLGRWSTCAFSVRAGIATAFWRSASCSHPIWA